jgi:hypothetical protein
MPTALKLAIDFGPLLIFFGANKFGGVFTATAAFMVATPCRHGGVVVEDPAYPADADLYRADRLGVRRADLVVAG